MVEYKNETELHFNEPMLSFGELGRCIGYVENDDDCYILVMLTAGEVRHHTMCGGYIWLDCLRGQRQVTSAEGEIWDDLYRLDMELLARCVPRQDTFRLEIK